MHPDAHARDAGPERPRRRRRRIALALLLAALALALVWLTRPPQVAGLVVAQLGKALDLAITAEGVSEYTWRGAPSITLREVIARRPGESVPLLRARRVHVELPWRTLRARGAPLVVTRIELDAPEIDLPALQRWLAARPPTEPGRVFLLTDGLAVEHGVLRGEGWRVEGITLDVPRYGGDFALEGELRGRYVGGALAADFALEGRADRATLPTPVRLDGTVRVETATWAMPAWLTASGALHAADGGFAIRPLRLGVAARYLAHEATVPFRVGAYGPLAFADGRLAMEPATLALRPQEGVAPALMPVLRARGALGVGETLRLDLRGALADWPDTWPALPAPVGPSDAPLPFALRYAGPTDLAAPVELHLARDAATFDARFRLPAVLDWLDAGLTQSPLPPLDGRLRAPRLEVAGATLEGVEIELGDAAP
ncbi:MAG: hypothetical protein ACOY9B_04445 [Pseudomonadota bacterium]